MPISIITGRQTISESIKSATEKCKNILKVRLKSAILDMIKDGGSADGEIVAGTVAKMET